MEKIVPFGKRILIKRLEAKQVTDGGIFIPTDARERPVYGVIRSISTEATIRASESDVVLFGKYSGVEVDVDGEILLLLKEDEIFGRVDDKALVKKYLTEGV